MEDDPSIRLEKKRDLYMFLALHMENSPDCAAPSVKFNKTGIVVCESDSVHKVIAMSCSRAGFHAVQQMILDPPFSLNNCAVYLSRKPCTTCTTLLIQGSISSVYYWPMAPERKGDDSEVEKDIQQADRMFLRSHISSSVLLPVTTFEMVEKIAKKIRSQVPPNRSIEKPSIPKKFGKCCSWFNMSDCEDACRERMENALRCYNFLLEAPQLTEEEEEKKSHTGNTHRHALQLCYFLAARSDDPNRGVGCVLYSQNGYFFGAGYNGYPIGILYGNLPWQGRKQRKAGFAKREFVVHAETNALLYRSKPKIEETDILYCTKPPCPVCHSLIKEVGIRKICYVQESSTEDEKNRSDDLKKDFDCFEWNIESMTDSSEQNNDLKDKKTEGRTNEGLLATLLEKEELCMFLALHMENLPSELDKSHCKTGIVICEASKPKRIIAVDCSAEDLHAVPKVLLRFPNALRGCEVYLSRMPCNYCAKLLVQAQVSQVYYWPNFEYNLTDKTLKDDLVKHTNAIFSESCVIAAVFVPAINNQRKQRILVSNKRASSDGDCIAIQSIFDKKYDANIKQLLKLEHLTDNQLEKYKENLTTAKDCFKTLAGTKDEKITILEKEEPKDEMNTPKYTHALQLCDLLASRSDNNNGVGTLIFSGDKIVALGYSGYPKGAMNSLFGKKADADFDKHAVVCAEANAIIMSSERDLSNTELITTSKPCSDCMKLIRAKKIAKIIWPLRDRKQS
ncbi:uncharacterized protein [Struthio camelus]|uniref:uncharacterized protein isoform X2 n=1 Tax=Struthio camelus TaxID=8801 RepID=UPI0036040B13